MGSSGTTMRSSLDGALAEYMHSGRYQAMKVYVRPSCRPAARLRARHAPRIPAAHPCFRALAKPAAGSSDPPSEAEAHRPKEAAAVARAPKPQRGGASLLGA